MLTFRYSVPEGDQVELAGGYVLTLGKSTWLGIASPLGRKECLENIAFILKAINLAPPANSDERVGHMHLKSNPGPDHHCCT